MYRPSQVKTEVFRGGIVLREFINPEEADRYGGIVLDLLKTKKTAAFYTPKFKRYENSQPLELVRLKKAWLSLGSKACSFVEMHADSTIDQQKVLKLSNMSDKIDKKTKSQSIDRALIIYEPKAVLYPHEDKGISTRIVNLTGVAQFRWHDENDDITDRVDLYPGDLLWTDDTSTHSVQATSDTPRVSLALIDYETKDREFLYNL